MKKKKKRNTKFESTWNCEFNLYHVYLNAISCASLSKVMHIYKRNNKFSFDFFPINYYPRFNCLVEVSHKPRRIIFITDANAVRETRKILSRRRIESNGNFRHQISAFPSRIRVPLDRQRVVARAIHRHDYWWQGSTHETHAKVAKNDVYRYKHFTEYHLKFFLRPHRDPVCIQPFSFLLLISEWSIFLSEFVTLLRNFHRFFEIFFSLLLLFS